MNCHVGHAFVCEMAMILVECRFCRKGDDAVGNPHRAQIYKIKLFELIILL